MDPEDRRLIHEIHGSVSGLKPILEAQGASLVRLDDRVRSLEGKSVEHGVRAERLEQDIDNLGRKVRTQQHQPPQSPLAKAEETSGGHSWLRAFEVLVEVPRLAHVVIVVGSVAAAVLAMAWGHWTGEKPITHFEARHQSAPTQ